MAPMIACRTAPMPFTIAMRQAPIVWKMDSICGWACQWGCLGEGIGDGCASGGGYVSVEGRMIGAGLSVLEGGGWDAETGVRVYGGGCW